jgi:hypothetical protein
MVAIHTPACYLALCLPACLPPQERIKEEQGKAAALQSRIDQILGSRALDNQDSAKIASAESEIAKLQVSHFIFLKIMFLKTATSAAVLPSSHMLYRAWQICMH